MSYKNMFKYILIFAIMGFMNSIYCEDIRPFLKEVEIQTSGTWYFLRHLHINFIYDENWNLIKINRMTHKAQKVHTKYDTEYSITNLVDENNNEMIEVRGQSFYGEDVSGPLNHFFDVGFNTAKMPIYYKVYRNKSDDESNYPDSSVFVFFNISYNDNGQIIRTESHASPALIESNKFYFDDLITGIFRRTFVGSPPKEWEYRANYVYQNNRIYKMNWAVKFSKDSREAHLYYEYTYDSEGRIKEIAERNDSGSMTVTHYQYYYDNNKITAFRYDTYLRKNGWKCDMLYKKVFYLNSDGFIERYDEYIHLMDLFFSHKVRGPIVSEKKLKSFLYAKRYTVKFHYYDKKGPYYHGLYSELFPCIYDTLYEDWVLSEAYEMVQW